MVPVDAITRLLELTPRRLRMLAQEGIIPRPQRGEYPMIATVQGYVRYLRERANARDGGEQEHGSLTDARARLTRSKADEAEMRTARLKGELLPADEVISAWSAMVSTVKTKLRSIATKLASRLAIETDTATVEKSIREEIDEALEGLARLEIVAEQSPSAGLRNGRRNGRTTGARVVGAAAESDGLAME